MADPVRKTQVYKKVSVKKETVKLNSEDRKAIACWVGQRILECQEKMDKTLEELSSICKKATKK